MSRSYGITNSQAKYLAYLCKRAGIAYTGHGMRVWEASTEIDRLRELLADQESTSTAEAPGRPADGARAAAARNEPARPAPRPDVRTVDSPAL